MFSQYTDWEDVYDGYKNEKMIREVVGDYFFICPSVEWAEQHSEHGNEVYFYQFNHVGSPVRSCARA